MRVRLFLALIVALALAACGGQQAAAPTAGPSATSASATDAPASAPTTPTSVAAATPSEAAAPSAAPAAEPTAPAPASAGPVSAALELVSKDLAQPVFVTNAGDGSGRLYVVEKAGTIAVLEGSQRAPQPFLDITDLVGSGGSEQGLLGLAFHPRYKQTGRLFVYYTAKNGDNTVARYQVRADSLSADPQSGVVLFAQEDPAANHNGGMLAFGPDGYLYVGLGDGGRAGDPWGNGQNRAALLGKILRLDVDGGEPYAIPADNPWPAGGDARAEIWAYGLRNPWRFSFDRATGDLYIADVGQNQYEEINLQPAGAKGGLNYGWNEREATHCFRDSGCSAEGMVDPIAEYSHALGCSVTGGYVYRGTALPALQGRYIFGDYCSGQIWTLRQDAPGSWQRDDLIASQASISSFGEDEAGELYLTDLGSNSLFRVVAGP